MNDEPELLRDHFLAEHRALEALCGRLVREMEADAAADVRHVLAEAGRRVALHMEVEEQWLFPRLTLAHPETADVLVRQDHRFRRQLDELRSALDFPFTRIERARTFLAELRAHARDEDELLYLWLERTLETAEKQTLVDSIRRTIERAA